MDNFVSRLYAHDKDLKPVRALVGRNGIRPNISDIHEILEIKQNRDNCRVWLDPNGVLSALALVDGYQNLCFDATQKVDISNLLKEVLPWALEAANRLFKQSALDTCEYSDSPRLPFLLEAGFAETGLRTFRYFYHPTEASSDEVLPDGFSIRPLNGKEEVPAWLEIHRRAHHESRLDAEYREAMMSAPSYDATMDFVMESPVGRLAAYCVCSLETSPDGRMVGYTDPIAVDPEFQGMGLGKAILRYGIIQLLERGVEAVELGTSSENLRMQRLAESVGFKIAEEKVWLRYEDHGVS